MDSSVEKAEREPDVKMCGKHVVVFFAGDNCDICRLQAGRASLEEENRELRVALQHAHLYFLQSNDLTPDDREMLDEMWAALRRGENEPG